MNSDPDQPRDARGIVPTLRAAISAGAVTGLLFGLADGIVAAWLGTADLDGLSLAACLAGSIALYSGFWIAVLLATGLAIHPWLRARALPERYLRLLCIGLGLGLFSEIYWWTRPYVFYGHPSLSAERLLATLGILALGLGLGALVARGITRLPRPVQIAVSAVVLSSWLCGGVYVISQSSGTSARGALNARNRDMPNVLLVVVDALRQDVLSCYGSPRVKTPVIDRLAAQGVLFENAFTQAPFTWTSFGSLLTGKYPRRHGLVQMAPGVRMSRDNVTLPYHLKRAVKKDGTRLESDDYLGGTFHTGTLSTGSGLLRGFDMYFEAMAGHDLVSLDDPWSVFRSDLLFYIFKNKISQRFDSGIVASTARDWLARHAGQRFVCMVHLYSTHTPYDPPAAFKAQYCDPAYSGPIRHFYAEERQAIEEGKFAPTPADLEQIRNLYYAGVAQADALIGDVVHELERSGAAASTLMVITSDHGESLGEHNLWEHDHMVQTNLRVPLVMCWPGHLPAGQRVSALTDEIDVLPTICEIAGIEPPHESGVRGQVDGRSLMPLVRGAAQSVREFSFAENGLALSVQDARWKLIVPSSALAADAWKRALAGGPSSKPKLFDLAADPAEDHDRIDDERDEAERLVKALREWDARMPIPQSEIGLSPRELEARLKQLGYTGGIGTGIEGDGHVHPNGAGNGRATPDPKSPEPKAPKDK
jgi:arylsulfatase A-like enzyme